MPTHILLFPLPLSKSSEGWQLGDSYWKTRKIKEFQFLSGTHQTCDLKGKQNSLSLPFHPTHLPRLAQQPVLWLSKLIITCCKLSEKSTVRLNWEIAWLILYLLQAQDTWCLWRFLKQKKSRIPSSISLWSHGHKLMDVPQQPLTFASSMGHS